MKAWKLYGPLSEEELILIVHNCSVILFIGVFPHSGFKYLTNLGILAKSIPFNSANSLYGRHFSIL